MSIEPAEVRVHASTIDQVAEQLNEAVSAAGYVRAGNESYGQLVGWMFTPALNHFADTFVDKARQMTIDTQRQADALRLTAAEAVQADEDAKRNFGGCYG